MSSQAIATTLADFPVPAGHASIALQPRDDGSFQAPPCIVFIDEVHQLARKVEQGLLAATENKTHRLETETGTVLDTFNVCWMIATTDRGLLFDAFDTRFSKVVFQNYSREEVTRIIKVHNPVIPDAICGAIARLCGPVTREALDFAIEVIHQVRMARCSWGRGRPGHPPGAWDRRIRHDRAAAGDPEGPGRAGSHRPGTAPGRRPGQDGGVAEVHPAAPPGGHRRAGCPDRDQQPGLSSSPRRGWPNWIGEGFVPTNATGGRYPR